MKNIHIGITGPIYTPSLKAVIKNYNDNWPKGLGGVPVNQLIESLVIKGYRVSVFSNSPDVDEGKEFVHHQDNLSIYIGPSRSRVKYQVLDFYKIERNYITESLKRAKPDIIHAHWQYQWAWAALDSGIPTLITCHDSPLHVLKSNPDTFRLFRFLIALIVLKKAKYLTTVSPYCAEGIKLLTNKHISIIPNYESNFVYSLYATRSISSDRNIRIAMINNGFTKRKNVEVGIQAFEIFLNKYPNSQLHLFGIDHGINEKAYHWCKAKNIDTCNIHFHGNLEFDSLMKTLSTMHVLLHTSTEESFGMVIVEAMAMGIPVVAGKESGGPAWILNNGGGILTDINNKTKVYQSLIEIVQKDTYILNSKSARKSALERYCEDKVVNMYITEYETLLKFMYN
ncbi:glycosyltransferase family 4 protein [Telluribacter sp. SYSU D00476]|uniref:glycosyltransferase family 4 protein n=1 Tax=Telluribacter sp. SYSU D00476 TaxID=2811430 RepID=UPI001FF482EF|nr:glycosyltransferase family 4 protein [Telluribacter sp. SYSU D00476]